MQQSWLRPRPPVLPSRRAAKPRARSLRIEGLESRVVPANLDLSSGTLAYAAGAGVNNNLSVTISGSNFVFTDTAETITTSIPGATGSGTNTVSLPTDGVTAITLDLADGSDTIAAAGVVVASANPNLTITAQNDLTLAGNVNAGTGTIAILANQDGTGTEGLSQSAGTITTTNTTNSALTITVNTPAGGTGNASIDSAAVGVSNTGGRLTVNSNGGSILYGTGTDILSDSLRGLVNGGSAPARTLVARSYVFTATGAGGIGTDGRPIQSAVPTSGTSVNLAAGSGGIYWTDWGTPVSLAGATATGAGNVRVVTANTTGHNLAVAGNVSTGSGNIYLASDDNISVASGVTIGGSGFSGTVWMQANRDRATAGQSFSMNANSAIVTTNTTNTAVPLTSLRTPTTQAVYLDISGDANTAATLGGSGGMSNLTAANIQTGDGGRIVLNAAPNAYLTSPEAEAGGVAMAGAADLLDAGPTGTVELVGRNAFTTAAATIGTAATPVRVAGGSVLANSNFGNVFVTGAGATSFAVTSTANVSGQTAAVGTTLATTAGPLTIPVPTSTVNGGALNLTSTGAGGGVVINAPLGGPTTGAITINAGGNPATLNTTLTLLPTSSVAVTAAGGLTVSSTGRVVGTGTGTNATALTVQTGGVVSPADANSVGTLNVGNLAVQAGGTIPLDLNSTSSFDALNVAGTVDVTGGTLVLFANGAFNVGDSFTVVANDGSDAVVGQFAGGTTIIPTNNPRLTFTLNYAGGDGNDIVATVSDIVTTSLVDVGPGGAVLFASGNGLDDNLTATTTGGSISITDASGPIALSAAAAAAGWTGGGTQTVTGPTAGVTGLTFNLNTGTDTLNGLDAGGVPLTISGVGSVAVAGAVSSAVSVTIAGVTDITGGPSGLLQAPTLSLTASNGIGTTGQRVGTKAGAIAATAGAGGMFLAEADGADVTASATGAGTVDVLNAAGTLNVAGAGVTTETGNIALSSGDAVTLGANLNAGSGTITIAANTDGAGTQGYDQKGATITTTSTTAGAVTITVNTPAAGTGDAVIGMGTVGNNTGGGYTVASNGGNVLWSNDPAYAALDAPELGLGMGGSNSQTLHAFSYAFTTGAAGGVGTDARPLQLDNFGANGAANAVPNLTAAAGTGGVYATVWDAGANHDLTTGTITAQGAGGIRVVTANAGGHNLWVVGNVSTGSGNIYLAADDNLTVGPNVVIGGAGFSGTVWMQANRDRATAGQPFIMDPTSAIVTTNTTNTAVPLTSLRTPTTQAVYLDISGDANTAATLGGSGGMSNLTVGSIQTGDGGRIVLNAAPNAYLTSSEAEGGGIAMAGAADLLDAGPTGTVELVGRNAFTTAAATIGTAAIPVRVAGGSVLANSNFGNVFVTGAGATSFAVTNTSDVSGQTAAVDTTLTTGGALTVGGATAAVNGGAINLTGAGGVVVAAPLGGAGTGAIAITGPLSGSGGIVLGTGGLTVTQDADSSFDGVISGPQGLVKAGTGRLTLTAANTYDGGTTVSAGSLLAGNTSGSATGTGAVTVADGATFGGAGAVIGAVAVSGTLSPGGTGTAVLGTGPLSFGAAGARTLAIDLNGLTAGTGYDQAKVTGAVDLTGATLAVSVGAGFTPALGSAFTVLANDGTVTGTFAGLAEGAKLQIGGRTYTLSYLGGDGNDVTLTVTQVDVSPPVNTVPAAQTTAEDTDLVFSAAAGNAISVADPGLGGPLKVTLTATRGVLSLSALTGLTFTVGDGSADATMTFTGTLSAVNTALDGLRMSPAADFNGSASVTITSDDQGASGGAPQTDTDSVTVTVTAVNDAPSFTLSAPTVSANEDAGPQTVAAFATGISAGPADEANQGLTFLVSSDNPGLFSAAPQINPTTGALTFTAAANANGTATVTVRLQDDGGTAGGGQDTSPAQTVTITIAAVNDPPVANDGTLSTAEDTAQAGTLTATDIDNPTLTYVIVSGPTHGTLSAFDAGTGAYTYTPAADFNGSDSFTFKANDGSADSNTATVSISVQPINDAPVVTDGTLTTDEDLAKTGTLIATDADGNALTFLVVNQPAHGSVTITNPATGAYTYTPAADYHGPDSFTFKATDGSADSNTGTVTVTVNSVNDAPVAVGGSVSTRLDTPLDGTASATDVDGDTLTYSVVTQPAHGTLNLTAATGAYTYTPDAGYVGPDSFTFRANDGTIDSNAATVSITVLPTNRPPVAVDGTLTTNEDQAKGGTLAATDDDGDTLTFSVVAGPAHGTVQITSVNAGTFTYTPDANYNGSDSFTFRVNDGTADSNTATVTITVNPVNDAPVAAGSSVTTAEDTATGGSVSATDVEGDALTYSVVAPPTHGNLVFHPDGTFTYTPAQDYNGTDSFTFKANDGSADSDPATVSITVTPVNDPPTLTLPTAAFTVALDAPNDTPVGAPLTAADVDGDTLTFALTADTSGGGFRIDPATGQISVADSTKITGGSYTVTVQVSDPSNATDAGPVTIATNLRPVLDPAGTPILTNEPLAVKKTPYAFAGGLVSDVLRPAFASDPDAPAVAGIAITGADTGNGTWEYNTAFDPAHPADGWQPITNVSDAQALVLAADADTRVRFRPNVGFKPTFLGFTFKAWDRADGAAEGTTQDTTDSRPGSAFSAESDTAWVKVGAAPLVTDLDGRTVLKPALPVYRTATSPLRPLAPVTARTLLGLAGLEAGATNLKKATLGVAITAADESEGNWEFLRKGIDKGYQPLDLQAGQVLLLRPTDLLRFTPTTRTGTGAAPLTFKTWDPAVVVQTPGVTTLDPTGTGFGAEPGTAVLDLAPRVDLSKPAILNAVGPGETTDALAFNDPAVFAPFRVVGDNVGVAITGATGPGTWQYSLDGGNTWAGMPSKPAVSVGQALLLPITAQVRFVAGTDVPGRAPLAPATAKLSVKAWDMTVGAVGLRAAAKGSAFSTETEVVTAAFRNHSPTLTPGSPTVTGRRLTAGDPTKNGGTTVAALLAGKAFQDADRGAKAGIAVTGLTATAGRWQYSLGKNVWVDFGTVGADAAVLLATTSKVRFLADDPAAAAGTLTFKAWDQSAGQAGDVGVDTSSATLDSFSTGTNTATLQLV